MSEQSGADLRAQLILQLLEMDEASLKQVLVFLNTLSGTEPSERR